MDNKSKEPNKPTTKQSRSEEDCSVQEERVATNTENESAATKAQKRGEREVERIYYQYPLMIVANEPVTHAPRESSSERGEKYSKRYSTRDHDREQQIQQFTVE